MGRLHGDPAYEAGKLQEVRRQAALVERSEVRSSARLEEAHKRIVALEEERDFLRSLVSRLTQEPTDAQ